jgi:peptidyl-prolyl cis-trans isomerase SurA
MMRLLLRIAVCAGLAIAAPVLPALAESQGVVAVVNDQPITERDISQRIALMKILGDSKTDSSRKGALKSLVDEEVKLLELEKFKLTPTDVEVNKQMERMAKGMDTTTAGLLEKLKKQGIGEKAFRRYVTVLVGFNRLISGKYRNDLEVDPKAVDQKFTEIKREYADYAAKIKNDPRMKPVTVYTMREILLPIDSEDPMLLQARAAEASALGQRIKGCGNIKGAAEGIFDVRVGKTMEVDAAKLPKPLRSALDQAGVGRAIGPMRSKEGIQLLALCSSRKLSPEIPKFEPPTRKQVEAMVVNEKYAKFEDDYMKTARNSVYIEYRDTSYSQ